MVPNSKDIVTSRRTTRAGKKYRFWFSRMEARKRTTSFGSIILAGSSPAWICRAATAIPRLHRLRRRILAAIYQHFGDRAYRDVDSATDYAIGKAGPIPVGWPFSAGAPEDHDFVTVTQTPRYRPRSKARASRNC